MTKKPRALTTKSGEIRDLTVEELRLFRPVREVDPEFLVRVQAEQRKRGRGPGRPQGRSKKVASLSLDAELLDALRASGPGWQTRVNDLLRAAVGLTTQ